MSIFRYRTPEQAGTILSYEFKGKLTTIAKFGTEKFDTAIKLGVSIPPKPKKREVNIPETGAILQLDGKLVFRGSHPSGRVYKSEIALNGEVRYELLSDDKGRPSPSEEFKKGGEDSSDLLIGLDGNFKVSKGGAPFTTIIPLKADFLTKSKVIGRDRTRRELGKTSNPGAALDFDGNINVTSGRRKGVTEQTKIKAHLKFWEISSTSNSV